ncbi:MAG: hypothetical protein QM722_11435 [Piscinibacter sp.]
MIHLPFRKTAAALLLVTLATAGHASCGAASCSLMTDSYAQGAEVHPGWSADLRLEAVTQKRLRSGTHTIAASDIGDEEAIERHTRNLNLAASLSHGFEGGWSLTLRAPLLRRDHVHDLIDESTGQPGEREQWRFTRLGDVQLTARRQFDVAGTDSSWALFGGFKLPTGSTRVANAAGARAERSLQPGSGTTDLVLGVAARHALGVQDAVFAQASLAQALGADEGYKPGRRTELSLGWSHAYSPRLGTVLQANLRQRGRDAGAQAEPEVSGSTTLDLSPGVTLAVGTGSTLYAYLQLPVYQKVNGIQLVPRSALALGWTTMF